jgi:hypothetical protein
LRLDMTVDLHRGESSDSGPVAYGAWLAS